MSYRPTARMAWERWTARFCRGSTDIATPVDRNGVPVSCKHDAKGSEQILLMLLIDESSSKSAINRRFSHREDSICSVVLRSGIVDGIPKAPFHSNETSTATFDPKQSQFVAIRLGLMEPSYRPVDLQPFPSITSLMWSRRS